MTLKDVTFSYDEHGWFLEFQWSNGRLHRVDMDSPDIGYVGMALNKELTLLQEEKTYRGNHENTTD